MRYYSEEEMGGLRVQLEQEVLGWEGVRRRTMFGCPAYSAGDTLFAFLVTRGLVLTRLGEHEREELIQGKGAIPFRAGPRTVPGWITVPLGTPGDLKRIQPRLRASYDAAIASSEPRK
ncbi:MAG: TfoX/Sxy family protein [Methanomicrobiales archaeon]|jgi:hypothetical protein|nr:TfoX/Sxy family protein [Methanomicrobiales archaeon]MDD1652192.1 TfoX/Sxy family protein [Methanomicrobiales archaeon]